MKLFRYVALSIIFLFGFMVAPQPAQAAEDWVINDFHANLTVQSTGKVLVEEQIKLNFNDLQKHGIFRDLPYVYANTEGTKTYTSLEITAVERNGQGEPYATDKNSQNLRLKIGDADKEISGEQQYTIRYEATGIILDFTDYDELYWNVTGDQWEVPIEKASATLTLPQSAALQSSCYEGESGSQAQCQVSGDQQTIHFASTQPLEPGEGMTVATGFTNDLVPILTVAAPKTVADILFTPQTAGSFGLVLLAGLLLLIRRWWQVGRDRWHGRTANPDLTGAGQTMPLFSQETIVAEYEPPAHLRPAELGVLVDERADTLDVTATIIDLASRGYLTITEIPKKWLFGSVDYQLDRLKKTKQEDKLLPYEQTLLDALFADGASVKLSALKNTFYEDLAAVKEQLYKDITNRDFFQGNPNAVRGTYIGIGIGIVVVGLGLTVLAASMLIDWLLGGGAGLVIVGLITAISAFAMPRRTALGRVLYRQALGYKLFIETAEKHRAQFAEKENLFNEILPYAIVFGLTEKFARAMKDLGITPPQPSWYIGTHPFNATVFASDINTFSQSLSTAIASTPSSSGSGGGGFSGGGFGGGGGGSW